MFTCYPVNGDSFASHNAFLDDDLSLCEVTSDAGDSAGLVHPVDVARLYRQTRHSISVHKIDFYT